MDRSGKVVNLTLWSAEAEGFNGSSCPVIAVKGCKVSDFGGRSLSTQFSSLLSIDPDIPEAHQLRGWFDSVGRSKEVSSISDQRTGGGGGKELNECGATSNLYTSLPSLPLPLPLPVWCSGPAAYLTIEQVKELDLGHGEKPDYFNCKSTITFSKKDNCLYKVGLAPVISAHLR